MARYLIAILALLVIAGGSVYILTREGGRAPLISDTIESSDSLLASPQATTSNDSGVTTSTDSVLGTSTEKENIEKTNGTTTEDVEGENIVIYTDAGFDPKEIVIVAGKTVTFVNRSTRPFSVASNVHPTHTLYPESSDSDCLGSTFDACGGVPSGSTWSFTFTKVGTWGFHDHLNPTRTGSVVVKKK